MTRVHAVSPAPPVAAPAAAAAPLRATAGAAKATAEAGRLGHSLRRVDVAAGEANGPVQLAKKKGKLEAGMAKKRAGGWNPKKRGSGPGEHKKNTRKSTQDKHQKAQAAKDKAAKRKGKKG